MPARRNARRPVTTRSVAHGTAHVATAALAAALAMPAFAAHPFITEDPGTQGTGRFELEMGAAARQGAPDMDGREVGVFPQLSIGAAPNVDLIAQSIWLRQSPSTGPAVSGHAGLLADVKWRFHEWEGGALAVRAGLDLPVGDGDTGFGSGRVGYHAIAIAGLTFGDYAVYANAAYARVPEPGTRANLGLFSVALTRPDDAPLKSFIEAATASNPDPGRSQWPAFARAGFICTVTPWLDVDVGYQARLNRAAARQIWLAGATLRW